ncbi:hypothetical protein FD755_000794 [Muntiacus reevesi]|uniref:NTF2-related export protein n=2 Tax=Muntiacus TaxID=9885 RepID=A0A5J5MZF3_MUNRE|nr:hypothetical protein FD754_009460 [Muntiacus muntjak]KAB0385838.1 hypothetical protein FD755_000794 [Muntiacus reevesi]
MGNKPVWEQIGSSFIQHYYQLFDNDRSQLGAVYFDVSCFTWEGQQFQGKAAIKTQDSITAQDHQPMPDSCIISTVVGQLKMFLSKSIKVAWICTNDMFRLVLHNLGGTLPARHSCYFLLLPPPLTIQLSTFLQMLLISTNKQGHGG